jgi:tRNA A-37 threonylcarbamoyl transferase component Bud32
MTVPAGRKVGTRREWSASSAYKETVAVASEGQILDGTYHLERLVGEGGMGAVYEATHARLAGRYAIKVLLRELSDDARVRARFEQEARITSLLQHPNVVQVIDHNTTADGTSYLVMEYLSGESLAARLAREGRLPMVQVVDIVDQLAAGVAAAHARGIVHRDLKPDNVILVPVEGRASEVAKILDFGISKVTAGRDGTDGQICGTPQYMAPEQADGRASDVDALTDQYALAVITLELLTGANPFAADTIEATFARIASVVVLETGLPAAVNRVLTRALSKDKAERFPSVTAFAEALRTAAAAAAEPKPEQRPGVPVRRARGGRRAGRLGFAATAAVAITSFVGTGAANRAPERTAIEHRPPVGATAPITTAGRANTDDAAGEALPRSRATGTILIASVASAPSPPKPAVVEQANAPARRAHAARAARDPARAARDHRPQGVIPMDPVSGPPPPPTLGPDEDATMPPSEF